MALIESATGFVDGAMTTVQIGMVYLDAYPALEVDFGALADHTVSGRTSVDLGSFVPGAKVRRARVRVAGEAFHGRLRDFHGTRVSDSPTLYDQSGAAAPGIAGQSAYVVDFGGVRSVLGLRMPAGSRIVLVLPWMGTDFGQKPLYPLNSTFAFYALPTAEPTGKGSVGFPAIETAKLFVQIVNGPIGNADAFAEQVRIVSSVLPGNLRASLPGRPVFFTHPGVLDREIELQGLVDELNATIDEFTAPTPLAIDLVSDTPGALSVLFDAAADLEVERSASALWGGQPSLALPLAALQPTRVELVFPTTDVAAWLLRGLNLELGGTFARWRAFGPIGAPQGRLATRIDARFSVARRVPLPGRVVLHGVALPLELAGACELRLELLAEADGAPRDGPPLATLDLALDGAGSGAATWCEALFATPIDSGEAEAVWLVLKAKRGAAAWVASAESAPLPPAALFTHEGGRWQRYPVRAGQAPAPQLRLLREPLPRENQPLLALAWDGTTLAASAEPGSGAAVKVEFVLAGSATQSVAPAGGAVVVALTATAAASGTLTLKRAAASFR